MSVSFGNISLSQAKRSIHPLGSSAIASGQLIVDEEEELLADLDQVMSPPPSAPSPAPVAMKTRSSLSPKKKGKPQPKGVATDNKSTALYSLVGSPSSKVSTVKHQPGSTTVQDKPSGSGTASVPQTYGKSKRSGQHPLMKAAAQMTQQADQKFAGKMTEKDVWQVEDVPAAVEPVAEATRSKRKTSSKSKSNSKSKKKLKTKQGSSHLVQGDSGYADGGDAEDPIQDEGVTNQKKAVHPDDGSIAPPPSKASSALSSSVSKGRVTEKSALRLMSPVMGDSWKPSKKPSVLEASSLVAETTRFPWTGAARKNDGATTGNRASSMLKDSMATMSKDFWKDAGALHEVSPITHETSGAWPGGETVAAGAAIVGNKSMLDEILPELMEDSKSRWEDLHHEPSNTSWRVIFPEIPAAASVGQQAHGMRRGCSEYDVDSVASTPSSNTDPDLPYSFFMLGEVFSVCDDDISPHSLSQAVAKDITNKTAALKKSIKRNLDTVHMTVKKQVDDFSESR